MILGGWRRHFRSLGQLVVRNSDGKLYAFETRRSRMPAALSRARAACCSPLFNVPIAGHGSIIAAGRV